MFVFTSPVIPVCYDLLFFTFQPVIIRSNGVSLITVAAVKSRFFCVIINGQETKILLWIVEMLVEYSAHSEKF